jgi:hypothetical protein
MANPQVVVDFVANTKGMQAAQGQLAAGGNRAGAAFKSAFAPAVATLGAVGIASKKAVDAASALNEQISASTVVFGKQAKAVQTWAKGGAEAFGLSQTEALKAANAYGNMFATVGLGQKDVTAMSKSMVQLAGDMASFHDEDPSEMLQRLRSGLSGEAEPLRQFGVLISEAAVKQEAYRLGLAKSGDELTEAQKVQARYSLIMQQTTKAQGDYARTADSAANQQRTLAAQSQNTAAAYGQALLPAFQAFQRILMAVLGPLTQHRDALTILIGVIAGLAAVVIAVNAAMALYRATTVVVTAATKAWAAAQWLINAALAANPIALVIIAVAALVAGLIIAYKTSDRFRAIVDAAFKAVLAVAKILFNWLKSNWPLLVGIIGGPVAGAVALVVRHWDTIRDTTRTAWNAVKSAVSSVVADIRNFLRGLSEWIGGWVSGPLAAVIHRVRIVFERIADGAHDAYAAVRNVFNSMVGWLSDLVGRVANVADRVASALKSPINAVIRAWNSVSFTIPSIKIPSIKIGPKRFGGGTLGGSTINFPDVPYLQAGGVINQPTLALVGEGPGREIVAPESLLREIVGDRHVEVRVFIGDQELRGLVRTEIVDANTGVARMLLAGAG